ncbi:EscJ/YscJ/HrcJ family type III secretion inner membrane ring protein [Chitinimonas arctica]|uniref:Lipoprotein n=1 Tax=Chitinimonas arctica TaxID=2594795 RepID=A0A516SAA2_9NEIS|nr:type III secretion inner membrane ring lipoprotein SctJ [Chitinimonas arctica]QDQ25072.1 EscJ/YscJ/HrcJ family type III secretion inner membrane ring protein [Chitinimonas arctica]
MKSFLQGKKWVWLLVLFLSACKVELYSNLPEEEANRMMAVLMLKKINADKVPIKSGSVAIHVDKGQFVDAVEVLRQNGLPERKRDGMNELFPSNQLVTSPAQEQAKMVYLKEQQLEKMLSGMDGVILSMVSIAESKETNSREVSQPSASVFIKYNPEVNLATREGEIKSLIHDAIPNLLPENISVVMQAAVFRYSASVPTPIAAAVPTSAETAAHRPAKQPATSSFTESADIRLWLFAGLSALVLVLGALFLLRKRER